MPRKRVTKKVASPSKHKATKPRSEWPIRPDEKLTESLSGLLGSSKLKFDPKEWKPVVIAWLDSGQMLSKMLRMPNTPSRRLVDMWRADDEEFANDYHAATSALYDTLADQVIEIADGEPELVKLFTEIRYQIDARIRMLSRWTHRYAEKRQVEQTGNGTVQIITGVPNPDTDSEGLMQ